MNLQNILNQFIGTPAKTIYTKCNDAIRVRGLNGAMAGGLGFDNKPTIGFGKVAAVGGVAALLIGSKKARSFAGAAAKIGGAALLGGLAYKAVKNWHGSRPQTLSESVTSDIPVQFEHNALPLTQDTYHAQASHNVDFQLVLIKAMISAAKADGHININEQDRIFAAVDNMDSPNEYKAMMMDLLRYPLSVEELAASVYGMEQKTELYLISCFTVEMTNQAEREHLRRLESALQLPSALAGQLREQALNSVLEAA